jgi:hypothetical protein
VPDDGRTSRTTRFVSAGLELLELEADEPELAVIEAVDALYGPPLQALIEAEIDGVEPEAGIDLSHPPRALESR